MRLIDADALLDNIPKDTVLLRYQAVNPICDMPTITLNTLRDEIYQDAFEHGLWDLEMAYPLDVCCERINDELKELAEAADEYEYKCASMDHFCEELADVIIMCMSVAGLNCIDIDMAVKHKMEVNKGRPWRHGKE